MGKAAVLVALAIYSSMQVRATSGEEAQTLPGDELIPDPLGSVNHAITIHRPAHDVWPWLAQMGAGRAGWFTYDFIDNGGQRAPSAFCPSIKTSGVGSVLPALPGVADVFLVARCQPEHSLVLSWRLASGKYQTTWRSSWNNRSRIKPD
jgi:hypothetical protein